MSTFLNRIRSTLSVLALLALLNSELSAGNRAWLTPGQLPAATPPTPGTPAAPLAQQPSTQSQGDQTVVQVPVPGAAALEIIVLAGQNGSNLLGKATAFKLSVSVRDARQQPIEGAVVNFIAPADGPSVVFAGGLRTVTVLTDSAGRGELPRVHAVNAGSFQVQVTASYHGQTASAVIAQTNYDNSSAPDKSKAPAKTRAGMSGTMLAVIIGAGAAAAIGIGLGLGHKSSNNSAAATTSATIGAPGTPVAGPP